MKVLGIIPARGGSRGVSKKNIRILLGKPLIVWTIEEAMASNLTRVIISTDNEEIAEVARNAGAEVPFVRPAELATDSANAIPVLLHALHACQSDENPFEAIMMLQPTSPMRLSGDINEAIDKMSNDPLCTSVISVYQVDGEHPARMKYLEAGKLIDPPFCESRENQARQELTPMYMRSGAIYLVRKDTLMKEESLKGNRCLAQVMPKSRSVNIDSYFDFELAEWLMSRPDWRNS